MDEDEECPSCGRLGHCKCDDDSARELREEEMGEMIDLAKIPVRSIEKIGNQIPVLLFNADFVIGTARISSVEAPGVEWRRLLATLAPSHLDLPGTMWKPMTDNRRLVVVRENDEANQLERYFNAGYEVKSISETKGFLMTRPGKTWLHDGEEER